MRRSLIGWFAIATCIVFGPAFAQRATAADLPGIAAKAEAASPESAALGVELARQYGFFRDLDESLVTPAIPWGKPLAGGPVRALIVNSWFAGREVVELAQRLDLKYKYVALLRERDFLPSLDCKGPGLFEPLEQRLVESLKGNEPVIAFSSSPCPWPDLRAPTRKAILDAIRAGKGLVYAGDPAPVEQEMGKDFAADLQAGQTLFEGLPPDLRGPDRGGAWARAGQFGKGRVVFLGFPAEAAKNSPLFSPTGGGLAALNDPQREAACSLLAKSLLWANRRASGVSVSLPKNLEFKSEKMTQGFIFAEISGPGVEWIDWFVQPVGDAPPVSEGSEHFPAPRTRAAFNLPALPAGEYVIHAIVRNAARASLAWTSASLTVTCDSRLEVKFSQPLYAPGESAAVTVRVTKAAQRDLKIECSLTDASGRIMAAETRAAKAGTGVETMLFKFPTDLVVAKTAIARATLFQRDHALVRAEAAAVVSRDAPRDGARNFLYYVAGGDCFREAAGQIGITAMTGSGETAARLDLDAWRRSAMPDLEIARTVPLDQLIRKPCLADPDYIAHSQEWVRAQARDMALTGELGLFVADGWNYAGRGAQVTNLDHSPASEKAFRDQARAEFGSLDRLNMEWGTHFPSWETVAAPHWEEACASGKFLPAWIDKRRAEESVVAGFFKKCADAGKEVNPGFRLALSGTPNPSDVSGYDWWKLMGAVDVVALGDGPQVQLARSFARPGQVLLRSAGDGPLDADAGRDAREIWEALFSGLDGVIAPAAARSAFFWPDLSLRPNGAVAARAVHALRAGPADLLAGATREDDGIAILYSQPSLHAAAAEGMRGRPVDDETYVRSLAGCEALLGDLGLQFRYVADEEVSADALRTCGCRLLVLPFAQAIPTKECEKIRSFVMAGGVVLADLCPGATDEHGKVYDFSEMDEVLGVKSLRHRPLYRPGRVAVQPQPELLLPAMEFEAMLGEPGLSLNGATAWAGFDGDRGARAPAATFYRFGAGMSMLLNFGLADYRAADESAPSGDRIGRAAATRKLVRTFLTTAQIGPTISVRAEPPAEGGFGVRFRSGNAVYLGLSAPPQGNRTVFISLAGLDSVRRFVYDVRAHKFLGHTENLEYRMKESCGELLALMPREIGEVSVRAPKRAERGRLIRVSVALGDWKVEMGRTVFRVEVYDPAGNLSAPYTQTVACDGGRAAPAIPFALNDAPGEWRIRAIEVVSGHSEEARVLLGGN